MVMSSLSLSSVNILNECHATLCEFIELQIMLYVPDNGKNIQDSLSLLMILTKEKEQYPNEYRY